MFVRVGFKDIGVVLRDLGIIIQWSSVTFLVPILFSLVYMEGLGNIINYALVAALAFVFGYSLNKVFENDNETGIKHAFMSVALVWLVYTAFAALPFVLLHNMSFFDAFFESMSALTTTGLSVMGATLNSAPKSLIFWRSLISWIGGIGIIVLALVGVLTTYTKSAKLLVAEGREERIKPNVKNTVKEIWVIYVILTALGVLLLFFSGMTIFDALNYSMSAISTTGIGTGSGALVGLHNLMLDFSLIIIMILGATSFSIHYLFLKKRKPDVYLMDAEFKMLILLSLASFVIIAPKLAVFYGSTLHGIEHAAFHVVSAITCGGFALVPGGDVFKWGDFVKTILIGIMIIGGASGSTAGGIKLSRAWIFTKSIFWRVKKAVLPEDSFFQRKFENRVVKEVEVKEISQFIVLYLIVALIGIFVITAQGYDLGNATFEVISAQSNVGISTGITHAGMDPIAQTVLIINMWVGRLEIIPLLAAVGFLLSLKFELPVEEN